jgi:bifunctional DNA-binding transcriptional regulator/antitoxin component of YhaV-PrlF toxin-antitoxin module
MDIVWFSIDAKGRVALPRVARELAHLQANSRVVGRVERGRIVLESAESVQARIWARVDAHALAWSELPAEDTAEAEAAALVGRERPQDGPAIDDLGEALLADLGL